MELATGVAAQIAQTKQNANVSFIKQNAQTDQQIANLLSDAARSVPNSPVRGVNVDINA